MDKEKILKILKNSKTQYAYDNKSRIYSAKFFINGKPRVLTMRLGSDFVEFSLADEKGNVLEVLEQKGGNVSFTQVKK